ncbi:MAG: hypothetical protein K9N07_06175 [Candidatus Cloacimonetes bacterium]|nr:hypothetical protein [Candidatus Cloacimonadota bacterium]
MENAIIGTGDHAALRSYFGLSDESVPTYAYSEVETIIANGSDIFSGFSLSYLYGSVADYGLDILVPETATTFMRSQDGLARGVYYDSGEFRTIAASSFFGALADGTAGNTKVDVMAQYLSFLIGDQLPIIFVDPLAIEIEMLNNQVDEEIIGITNTGASALVCNYEIPDPNGNIDWLILDHDSAIIDPDESDNLELTFSPNGLDEGQYFAEIVISHNDPNQNDYVIPVTMTVNSTSAGDNINNTTKLISNYPNPFNPSTTISFSLTAKDAKYAKLEIYNLKGQKVKDLSPSLCHPEFIEGREGTQYKVIWNGTDENNQPVSSGIYLYKLKTDSSTESKRMILLK